MVTRADVAELYVATFNRAPDADGLDYWTSSEDFTIEMIAKTFFDQDEAQVLYPEGTSNESFVIDVYKNLFNRLPDTAGYNYWVDALDNGSVSRSTAILAFINGAQGSDAVILDNKTEVGLYYADQGGEDADFYLDDIDATEDSVENGQAAVDSVLAGSVDFSLTASTDSLFGTSGDDMFEAPITQNQLAGGVSNSLSTADNLDGGAGSDTLYAELVPEFFGVSGTNQMDVQPRIQDVEEIQIEAMDVGIVNVVNNVITLDAKKIVGVEKIGSAYSDGDLVIENLTTIGDNGNVRNTADITVTMDHTDNFNSDGDASDLTVYFDEDYLLSGQTNTVSQMNYWLLDEDSEDYATAPLLNIERDGVTFTVDGTAIEVRMDEDVAEAADTWEAFAAGLQARVDQMLADGETILEGITVTVDYTNTDQTYNDFGNLVTIPAITFIDSEGRDLVPTGFTSPEDATGRFDIYGDFNNIPSEEIDDPITVQVELEKAGREGEGGNLVIGGKSQDALEGEGIEVFNISVLGEDDKPSNLGRITSTNNALRTVNIATVEEEGQETYAGLTVRGEVGDLDAASQGGSTPFGGTLDTINATQFKGDLTIGNETAALNVNTLTATGGGDVDFTADIVEVGELNGAYSYTTGSGDDTVTVDLDGDAVDTIGESFIVATGGGTDTVHITMDDGVSFRTMDVLHAETDNNYLNISTGAGADGGETVTGANLGVNLDAYGTFNIDTGDDSDFVRINSVDENGNATTGVWTFGDFTGPQDFNRVLYKAQLTVSFAGFEETVDVDTDASGNFIATQTEINDAIKLAIDNNEELSQLLNYADGTGNQGLIITSTVGGENTLAVALYQPHIADEDVDPVDGEISLVSGDETALAQGLIDTGAVADSTDVDTTAELIDEMNDISGSIDQDGNGDTQTYTDAELAHDIADAVPDAGVDIFDTAGAFLYQQYDNGGSSDSTTGINLSTIDLGNGANDIVVMHSNDASANVLAITGEFGKNSVVNFHDVPTNDVNLAAEVGQHALDFSTFLNDQEDVSDNEPNAQSVDEIVTTVNNVPTAQAFGDSAAGTAFALANSVNIIRFDGSIDDDDDFDGLSASVLVNALNDAADDGTSDYGNLDGDLLTPDLDTQLVGSIQNHIIMVENDQNEGEYKVFHVTSSWDKEEDETTSVSAVGEDDLFDTGSANYLGTLDFGASVNLNVTNTVAWETYVDNLIADLDDVDFVPDPIAPVAADDAILTSVVQGNALTIPVADLLANDSDADTDAADLEIVDVTYLGTDGSTVALAGDEITFTAAADFEGTASFQYTLSDNDVETANDTAVVTVPVIAAGSVNPVDIAYGETDEVAATDANDVFNFDAVEALADADALVTQASITGFATDADSFQLDITTAAGATTLDQLNGVDGIAVQADPFAGNTLINFGNDANGGEPVTLTLVGITDASLIDVVAI